jgi:hypothetical protein
MPEETLIPHDEQPKKEEKKPIGVKALMAAAYFAGAASVGVPLVTMDKSEEDKLIEMQADELKSADVRKVAEMGKASDHKTKFNPLKYIDAGDSVLVYVRHGSTDSLMGKIVLVSEADGSLFVTEPKLVKP